MKTPIKLTLAVAVLASASTSFADDPQMRNLLELRRLAAERNQEAASAAVYTGTHGIGGTKSGNVVHAENAGTRFEWRANAHGDDPRDAALRGQKSRLVRECVLALPDDLREAVILSEYEDLSHLEIARIAGCTTKAIETRLYRRVPSCGKNWRDS